MPGSDFCVKALNTAAPTFPSKCVASHCSKTDDTVSAMPQWLDSKSQPEVRELLWKARNVAPEFKQMYRERRKQILDERAQLQQSNVHCKQLRRSH